MLITESLNRRFVNVVICVEIAKLSRLGLLHSKDLINFLETVPGRGSVLDLSHQIIRNDAATACCSHWLLELDFILLRDILLIENFIIILIIRLLVFRDSIILIISRLGVNNSRGGYPAWDLIMNKLVGNSIPVLEVEPTQLAIILAKEC